ncbi:sterigmatocystin 8-O-methyltransferase [Annulohypoxylon stygium]|nr:sterigmatocystin 8-O-methyltransferase [Annulohypoxylon stygium]
MESPRKTPRIVELAAKINASVTELQGLLSAQGMPSPSFNKDSSEHAVLDATTELHELLMDPIPLTFKFSATTNMVGIDAICRFHITNIVPLIRHTISMRILKKPKPSIVVHIKISKYFTLPYINDWLSFNVQKGWPAATRMLDAIEKWPGSEESNNTGFFLINNTDKLIFKVLYDDPTRAVCLTSAIKAHKHFLGYTAVEVLNFYDWAFLGDVFISFKKVKLFMQDMEMVIKGAKDNIPNELKDTITPKLGEIPLRKEHELKVMDLNTGAFFNGYHRYVYEWKVLLVEADERFVF